MMSQSNRSVEQAYALAREQFSVLGVDTEQALERLSQVSISLQCWQGDDVRGFESLNSTLGNGLAVTGNYPGRARTGDELRADLELALSLIPGRHRVNLHACYAEAGNQLVDRDELRPEHFQSWIEWARELGLGLDFNPTCFLHPKAHDGFTLTHPDKAIRQFWIEHCRRCREIGTYMGQSLGSPCIVNIWIPDGYKDTPIDRLAPRQRLRESLDTILSFPPRGEYLRDAVESKLFGIGSESYVAGSHEFYLGYAVHRGILLCLDLGHFHPTESVADKISSLLLYLDRLLLHVSRGVRWDSDHVVIRTDELRTLAQELVRGNFLERVHLGLDYFDASINRIAAWTIGTRATIYALLEALLEPIDVLREVESQGNFTARLALLEEFKNLPVPAVWDFYCTREGVPVGRNWLQAVEDYEQRVLCQRTMK